MKRLLLVILVAVGSVCASPSPITHMTPPDTCTPGMSIMDTMSQGLFYCISTNTWRYQPISTLTYTQVGVANGVPPLDSNTKIPLQYLPDSVLSGGPGGSGSPGASVRSGSGVPGTGVGNDGDFYVDLGSTLLSFYGPKASGTWPSSTFHLVGAPGTSGNTILNGTGNPTTVGVNGDFYLNTSNMTIFGPKASGVWPTGVQLTGGSGQAPQGFVLTSGSTPFTITHNLHTKSLDVTCLDSSGNHFTPGKWTATDIDNVVISNIGAPPASCSINAGVGPTGATGATGPSGSGPGGSNYQTVKVNSSTATQRATLKFSDSASVFFTVSDVGSETVVSATATGSSSGPGSGVVATTLVNLGTDCAGSYLCFITDQPAGQQLYAYKSGAWYQYNTVGASGALIWASGSLDVDVTKVPFLDSANVFTGLNTISRLSLGAANTPSSSTASCTAGELRWDANYFYICTATNTWKRSPAVFTTF